MGIRKGGARHQFLGTMRAQALRSLEEGDFITGPIGNMDSHRGNAQELGLTNNTYPRYLMPPVTGLT